MAYDPEGRIYSDIGKEYKQKLIKLANKDNRSLSNFIAQMLIKCLEKK